jgi:CMP-N,N'-diacetyllegionaminic acid synthase
MNAPSERILGLVPARAGSKGIPNKNARLLAGIPLLARAIRSGLDSGVINRVLLTTDSREFAELGMKAGAEVPFMRPPELARDDTPMLPVIQHAVRHLVAEGWSPEIVVLLQPTAPFRQPQDIMKAVRMLRDDPQADSVVSVEAVPDHHSPYFVMKVSDNRLLPFMTDGLKVTRRQDAPKAYSRNGQFYVMRTRTLLEKNSIYGENCLPYITSHEAVNLDTMDDWVAAEKLGATFFR